MDHDNRPPRDRKPHWLSDTRVLIERSQNGNWRVTITGLAAIFIVVAAVGRVLLV